MAAATSPVARLWLLFWALSTVLVVTPARSAADPPQENRVALQGLQRRLVESMGDEYIAVRDEALALPGGSRAVLLASLRAGEEYSLERVLALILEARSTRPDHAAEFDANLAHAVENPDMGSRSGRPLYRIWTSSLPKEQHPFAFEEMIKLKTPVGAVNMIRTPILDDIPFWLYKATHEGIGAVGGLVRATEGHPEERDRLRPIVLGLYRSARAAGEVETVVGVYYMFRAFGTDADLRILEELRDSERDVVWQELEDAAQARLRASQDYDHAVRALQEARATGADDAAIAERQVAVDDANRRVDGAESRRKKLNRMWDAINSNISHLQRDLAQRRAPTSPPDEAD